MQLINDKALIQLIGSSIQRENDKAFTYLYRDYYKVIKHLVLANNGVESDAEDIFQDALIVLFHQVKKNNLTLTCSLKTYLYSICRNLWLKRLRQTNRIVELSDLMKQYVAIDETHLQTLEHNEQSELVKEMLEQLGADCKQMLVHFYFEKMKMVEIAKTMGLSSEQVAKNKKSNCMKKLKKLIGNSNYLKTNLR